MEQNVAHVNLMSKIGWAKHKVAIPIPPLSGDSPSSSVQRSSDGVHMILLTHSLTLRIRRRVASHCNLSRETTLTHKFSAST